MDGTTATEVVDQQWRRVLDLLGEVADRSQWSRPTRLDGWDVHALARHVHWGMTLEADGLRLAQGGEGVAAGLPGPDDPDQLLRALGAAHRRLVEELRATATDDDATVPMPYGRIPLPVARTIFVMEAGMHRSDVEHAVRGEVMLARDVVGACAEFVQTFGPALAAGAEERPPAGTRIRLLGTAVDVGLAFDGRTWSAADGEPTVQVEGSDTHVLLHAYGRLPLAHAALRVTGDRRVAERFKAYVPGP